MDDRTKPLSLKALTRQKLMLVVEQKQMRYYILPLLLMSLLGLASCMRVEHPVETASGLTEYGVTIMLYSSPTGAIYTLEGRAVTALGLETELSRIITSLPHLSALVKITDNTSLRDAASLRAILERVNLKNVHYCAISRSARRLIY